MWATLGRFSGTPFSNLLLGTSWSFPSLWLGGSEAVRTGHLVLHQAAYQSCMGSPQSGAHEAEARLQGEATMLVLPAVHSGQERGVLMCSLHS